MARFLTTAKTLAEIEEVIQRADGDLYLVSPFVQLSEQHRRRLADLDGEAVTVHVVCRVATLNSDQKDMLSSVENLRLYDSDKLHAKAFANSRGVVLTSLNLYEASEKNYEMGVYLDADEDRQAFEDAMDEIRSVIKHSEPVSLSGKKGRVERAPKKKSKVGGFLLRNKRASGPPEKGHCIRCGTSADYDPKKPYCGKCFRQWLRFKNPTYADDRCHGCGKEEPKGFSLEKPECYPCYKKHSKEGVTA